MDYAMSAIRYAHRNYPQVSFSVGDAMDPPYIDNLFDLVICNNLWEHVPDPLRMLRAVHQITKPHGYLIISTPSRYRLRNLVRVLRGRPVVFMSPHHVTEYTVGQVAEQLRFGNYTLQDTTTSPDEYGSVPERILSRALNLALRVVGSGHRLESTVFYLAQKA
jgi:SAM-dependent methyltransferase